MKAARQWVIGARPPLDADYIAENNPSVGANPAPHASLELVPRPCKVIIVGESGVGKTSLVNVVKCGGRLPTEDRRLPSTIGTDFASIKREYSGDAYRAFSHMHIWDTAGQERFDAIVGSYFRDVDIVVLCYDQTRPETLDLLCTRWLPKQRDRSPGAALLLVANKDDAATQESSRAQALELSHETGATFVETSAHRGPGAEAFLLALRDAMLRRDHQLVERARNGGGGGGASAPRPLSLLEGEVGDDVDPAAACAC